VLSHALNDSAFSGEELEGRELDRVESTESEKAASTDRLSRMEGRLQLMEGTLATLAEQVSRLVDQCDDRRASSYGTDPWSRLEKNLSLNNSGTSIPASSIRARNPTLGRANTISSTAPATTSRQRVFPPSRLPVVSPSPLRSSSDSGHYSPYAEARSHFGDVVTRGLMDGEEEEHLKDEGIVLDDIPFEHGT